MSAKPDQYEDALTFWIGQPGRFIAFTAGRARRLVEAERSLPDVQPAKPLGPNCRSRAGLEDEARAFAWLRNPAEAHLLTTTDTDVAAIVTEEVSDGAVVFEMAPAIGDLDKERCAAAVSTLATLTDEGHAGAPRWRSQGRSSDSFDRHPGRGP